MIATNNSCHNVDSAEQLRVRHVESIENVCVSSWLTNDLLQPRSFLAVFVGQLIEVTD